MMLNAYVNRGIAKRAKGDLDGAIADSTKVIELKRQARHPKRQSRIWRRAAKAIWTPPSPTAPKPSNSKPQPVEPNVNQDAAEKSKGGSDGAIANSTATSTKVIDPKLDDAEAYVKRGVAKLAKGDLDGAIADSTRAIELKPDDAEAYVNRGVAKLAKGSSDAAIADFTKAIELNPNDAIGHYFLGFCYANGAGVKKDAAEAVRMYRKAAEQNLAQAQCSLGLCYYQGEGVAKNAVEAYAWFSMAAGTDADAARSRDRLERELTPQQFKAAQKRAKELQSQIKPRFNL